MEKSVSHQQTSIHLQRYCRTCGNSKDELISIFDDEGLGYELNIKISTYLHLQVDKSDILPLNVCIQCMTTLLSFHKLYLCCLKAKEHFENIILTKNGTNRTEIQEPDKDVAETYNSKEKLNNLATNEAIEDDISPIQSKSSAKVKNSKVKDVKEKNAHPKHIIHSCQHCTDNFQNKADLIDHLKEVHTDLIFLCDVCKDYLPRNTLLEHMTSHAISLEVLNRHNEEHKCEKCSKIFISEKKYQRHKTIAHQRLYQCLDCDKTFSTNRVLRNHINHKHSDKRKYECDECLKKFKTDSGLYAHRKTHTDTYDYSCQICLKKFKFKVHLSRHLTMHSREKNYFCRFCSKSFGIKDNLNKHLKTHYKLFEFKCHICEFITSQRRYLAMHMKTSHLKKL